MIRFMTVAVCLVLASPGLDAANKEESRLEESGVVIEEILAIDDNIPQDLLDKAECVIVIPSMLKIAIGIGGSYGRGAMVCRTGQSFDGPWGAPAMYALEGGSVGLQIGAQATDLVLLVMNDRGVKALLNSKVTLGGNASAAADPRAATRAPRPTRRCAPRFSATPALAGCSPACRSRARRCVLTMTPASRSTDGAFPRTPSSPVRESPCRRPDVDSWMRWRKTLRATNHRKLQERTMTNTFAPLLARGRAGHPCVVAARTGAEPARGASTRNPCSRRPPSTISGRPRRRSSATRASGTCRPPKFSGAAPGRSAATAAAPVMCRA